MNSFQKKEMEYHPILLQESKAHYDTKGLSTIIEFEQTATIEQGFGVISYNLIRYKMREKRQNDLDEKKIETFKAWEELLRDLLSLGYQRTDNLRYAMSQEYPHMKYSLNE